MRFVEHQAFLVQQCLEAPPGVGNGDSRAKSPQDTGIVVCKGELDIVSHPHPPVHTSLETQEVASLEVASLRQEVASLRRPEERDE